MFYVPRQSYGFYGKKTNKHNFQLKADLMSSNLGLFIRNSTSNERIQ